MPETAKAPVNPALLQWARERAGFSLEEAAARARLAKGRGWDSPAERLHAFETGEEIPSVAQAEDIAHAYRRPLVTFFLPEPPQESRLFADFRTVANREALNPSPEFAALQLRIAAMHDTLKEIAVAEDRPSLHFVGSLTTASGENAAVAALRELCGTGPRGLIDQKTPQKAFSFLRQEAHKQGIYVVLLGNLGSYHTNISPEEFRGIAVADPQVPLVVINTNDAVTAQIFTLAHELVHILLGDRAISNLRNLFRGGIPKRVETFCNRVAGEFLVPRAELLNRWEQLESQETLPALDDVSRSFNVSRFVVLKRLCDTGLLMREEYRSLWRQLESQRRDQDTARHPEETESGGPSRNILDHYRLGYKFLDSVIGAAEEGIISYSEAARTLRVPPARFDKVRFPKQGSTNLLEEAHRP